MAKRKRLPKLDPCKVNLKRLRKLSADQLMNVWARLAPLILSGRFFSPKASTA